MDNFHWRSQNELQGVKLLRRAKPDGVLPKATPSAGGLVGLPPEYFGEKNGAFNLVRSESISKSNRG